MLAANERGALLSQWLCHNDSTINTVLCTHTANIHSTTCSTLFSVLNYYQKHELHLSKFIGQVKTPSVEALPVSDFVLNFAAESLQYTVQYMLHRVSLSTPTNNTCINLCVVVGISPCLSTNTKLPVLLVEQVTSHMSVSTAEVFGCM